MKKNIFAFLAIIIFIAAVLRLWNIDKVPISPDWDEVSLGYNSYSILQTGKDEYGKFLPVVLRSYDDYKPALYAYLAIPSIKVFGLNVFSVRLPSAIFGIIAVLGTFFLVRELFKKDYLALMSAFLLAISPWHIQFSRIAFESNVGLTFNILTALFFLKGLKNPIFLFVSVIFADLALYVYQSEKVFTSLLLLSLVLIFRKELFAVSRKYLLSSLIIGFLILVPMLNFIVTNKYAFDRAKGVSIFSDQTPFGLSKKILDDTENKDKLGLIIDNRRVSLAKTIIAGYISHFDLNWLFIRGDISRHHATNMGLLYLFELPLVFIGIYILLFGKFDRKIKLFVFSWFLIAPIPASVTSGVPHAVRTLNFLPSFQIFSALGLLWVFSKLSDLKYRLLSINLKYPVLIFIFIFFIFNFLYFLDQYFVQQNYFNAIDWQYGYAKIVPIVGNNLDKYKKVIVSNQPPMDQSYMFFLFYLRYPPSSYQSDGQYASGGFRENHKFGKFEFRPIDWDKEERSKDTVFVGRFTDFPHTTESLIESVSYPNGQPAMLLVK